MQVKTAVATGVLAAFLGGAVVGAFVKGSRNDAAEAAALQQAYTQQYAPAPRRAYAAPAVYRETAVREVTPVRKRRSTEKQVLIVAGSSGAGAGIGALAGGKKGAAIGAIAGAVGGLIYNEHTKDKRAQ